MELSSTSPGSHRKTRFLVAKLTAAAAPVVSVSPVLVFLLLASTLSVFFLLCHVSPRFFWNKEDVVGFDLDLESRIWNCLFQAGWFWILYGSVGRFRACVVIGGLRFFAFLGWSLSVFFLFVGCWSCSCMLDRLRCCLFVLYPVVYCVVVVCYDWVLSRD